MIKVNKPVLMDNSKFKIGDKVRISPKYHKKYVDTNTTGEVVHMWTDTTRHRKMYEIQFTGQNLRGWYYSYELGPVRPTTGTKRKFDSGDNVIVKNGDYRGCEGVVIESRKFSTYSGSRRNYIVQVFTTLGKRMGEYFSYELDPKPLFKETVKTEEKPPKTTVKQTLNVGDKVLLSDEAKIWISKNVDRRIFHGQDLDGTFTISKVWNAPHNTLSYKLEEFPDTKDGRFLAFLPDDLIVLPMPKYKVGDKVRFTRTSLVKLAVEKSIYFGENTIDKLPDIITNVREINWWGYHKDRVCYSVTGETFGKYFFEDEIEPVVSAQTQLKEELENKNVNKDYINCRIPEEYHRRLKSNWKEICNRYLHEFCNKHEYSYEPDMWVGSDPGTIIEVCDMFVSMENIRYDIDNNISEDKFAKWYWKNLELYELGVEHWMNYPSYCKGAPDEWTEERIARLKDSKKRLEEAEQDFKRTLDEELTKKS